MPKFKEHDVVRTTVELDGVSMGTFCTIVYVYEAFNGSQAYKVEGQGETFDVYESQIGKTLEVTLEQLDEFVRDKQECYDNNEIKDQVSCRFSFFDETELLID